MGGESGGGVAEMIVVAAVVAAAAANEEAACRLLQLVRSCFPYTFWTWRRTASSLDTSTTSSTAGRVLWGCPY